MSKRRVSYERWQPWPETLSVGARRVQAERRAAELAKKGGRTLSPVVTDAREVTTTFWGDAWCKNLEGYSDFANRLPRGRSYLRNGSVLDLQIAPGSVTALVSGTEIYDVEIAVTAVPQAQWRAICRDSAGAIDSVVELLQGKLSTSVMARLCRQGTGLFPTPREIRMSCSCPDSAAMCKHIAAVLYGIGVRLDHAPALLFTLRKVEASELIERAVAPRRLKKTTDGTSGARRINDESSLADIFGLDIATRRRGRKRR